MDLALNLPICIIEIESVDLNLKGEVSLSKVLGCRESAGNSVTRRADKA